MNFIFKCLFGSLVLFQCLLNTSFATIPEESPKPPVEEEELQTQQLKTAEKVAQVAERILSMPEEDVTFENTLGLWQRLIERISSNADGMTNQGIGDALLTEMQCSPEFYLALKRNALLILSEKSSNVFQKHIARCFLENCEQTDLHNLLYMKGCAEEKDCSQEEFKVVDLAIENISEDQIIELTKQILDSNADILCLREMYAENCPSFFDALKNDYPHIYIAANVCGKEFSSSSPWIKGSIFIASKYAFENMKNGFRILSKISHRDDDRKAGGGVEVGIDVKYGGQDGTQYDVYVKGEGHDDQGNYVEGRVDHNLNSGEGTASFRGGSNKD